MKIPPYIILLITILLSGCYGNKPSESNIIFESGAYPSAICHKGMYYYMMQIDRCDTLFLFASPDIRTLVRGQKRMIMRIPGSGMHNIYSPEIHRINNRWYVYCEADDGGNTDNHELYVFENTSDDPMTGEWVKHGPIVTNKEWNFGLHPSPLVVNDRLYLFWSGWPKRRIENETQCIYIAEMSDPWTLKSERVVISEPEYEWERQWINPDGTRTAYPIFVNENPQPMISPDGSNVIVPYSASGIWTVYNSLGILYASANSDLLNPKSWVKMPEPQFIPDENAEIYGTSNISVVPDCNSDSYYLMYQAKHKDTQGHEHSDVRIKEMHWNDQGFPEFGKP
ncbi:family 43 glycosylhydrolase [uncultured Muribaculum sp.]|uniref:family 43 glycosylhydrolase n=1 Tax=uncultured Muribaculum sp. TaxID=1918613 RepID=UPI0025F25781|nr:family 43 glycosylhydrolase [uncultured Muribaculum sp.]